MRVPLALLLVATSVSAAETPLRIDFVEPAKTQPHRKDARVIWYDDFDTDRDYHELRRDRLHLTTKEALGRRGRSLESFYARGSRGKGGRKLLFGDAPFGNPVRRGERFDEIYWRYYVRYQRGWRGGGEAKHSRAIVFTSPRWTQASILHVWTAGVGLTLDPVRGVRGDRVVTTRYNDFDNLKWLGNRPRGTFPFHAAAETGRWVCVEAHYRLNTPGKKDGVARLWVDGRLDAERSGMDSRGAYTGHGINAVFLEAYWNDGSPVNQSRWIDDFVVSTARIGGVAVPARPVVHLRRETSDLPWQLEVIDLESGKPVWRSTGSSSGRTKRVDAETGRFSGALEKASKLRAGGEYVFRVRGGRESDWSPRHWPVRIVGRD